MRMTQKYWIIKVKTIINKKMLSYTRVFLERTDVSILDSILK